MQKGDLSKEFLEKIAATEPQWMRERRLEAYTLYESSPRPHTTEDDVWRRTVDMRTQDYWRRTRRHLRSFAVENYHTAAEINGGASAERHEGIEDAAGVIVQVDGQLQHATLSAPLEKQDVYFADLHTALNEHEELIRNHFMTKAVTLETTLKSGNIATRNAFDALHGAFWQGGYVLYVPKGVRVEVPCGSISSLPQHNTRICHMSSSSLKRTAKLSFLRIIPLRPKTQAVYTVARLKFSPDRTPTSHTYRCKTTIGRSGISPHTEP